MRVADVTGRTVVITGGSAGIGKETACALARAGARVVVTSRSLASAEGATAAVRSRSGNPEVYAVELDLADMSSVRGAAREVLARFDRIDVLVNNAGVKLSTRRITLDGLEATFATNHLGHFLLTQLLLGRLVDSAPSRIVTVSSRAHRMARAALDFDDLQSELAYSAMRAYARSKLANILFTRELARRLDGTGVTANCLHPGSVATDLGRGGDTRGIVAAGLALGHPFMLSPWQGARTSIYLAASRRVADVTGGYFVHCRPRRPSEAARDSVAAARLWQASEELVRRAALSSVPAWAAAVR